MGKGKDLLRNMENPSVLGYEIDCESLTPIRRKVCVAQSGDYGADPIPGGMFKMIPSGDVVCLEEMKKRLHK